MWKRCDLERNMNGPTGETRNDRPQSYNISRWVRPARQLEQQHHAAVHHPFDLEAAILSRIRSRATSRSNWAKESSLLSVSRPMLGAVLKCWVGELTPKLKPLIFMMVALLVRHESSNTDRLAEGTGR